MGLTDRPPRVPVGSWSLRGRARGASSGCITERKRKAKWEKLTLQGSSTLHIVATYQRTYHTCLPAASRAARIAQGESATELGMREAPTRIAQTCVATRHACVSARKKGLSVEQSPLPRFPLNPIQHPPSGPTTNLPPLPSPPQIHALRVL
eukprot:scaffold9758_cov29-Tisochrysis_lutea.AAC.3